MNTSTHTMKSSLPLLLAVYCQISVSQPVYKSVDAEGNVSYGDAPVAEAIMVEAIHLDNNTGDVAENPEMVSATLVAQMQQATARLQRSRVARESARQQRDRGDANYPVPVAYNEPASADTADSGNYYPYYPYPYYPHPLYTDPYPSFYRGKGTLEQSHHGGPVSDRPPYGNRHSDAPAKEWLLKKAGIEKTGKPEHRSDWPLRRAGFQLPGGELGVADGRKSFVAHHHQHENNRLHKNRGRQDGRKQRAVADTGVPYRRED